MTTTHKKGDFEKFMGQEVMLMLQGGRQISGTVRGYDDVTNLVVDNAVEYVRNNQGRPTQRERKIGLLVVRGLAVDSLCALDGMVEIDNPYV